MTDNKHSPPGPVANGTATGYATGDAMFKAAAKTDRATWTTHAERDAILKTQWRQDAEDDAEESHPAAIVQPVKAGGGDDERASANEPAERGD